MGTVGTGQITHLRPCPLKALFDIVYYIASIFVEATALSLFTKEAEQPITHNDHLKNLLRTSPPYLLVLSFLNGAIFLLFPVLGIFVW